MNTFTTNDMITDMMKSMMRNSHMMHEMFNERFSDNKKDYLRKRSEQLMKQIEKYKKINEELNDEINKLNRNDVFGHAAKFKHDEHSKDLKKITVIREYETDGEKFNIEDEIIVNNPKNKAVNVGDVIKDYMDNLDSSDDDNFENDKYLYERESSSVSLNGKSIFEDDDDCIEVPCNEFDEDTEEVEEENDCNEKDCITVKISAPDDSSFTEDELNELKDSIIDAVEKTTEFKASEAKNNEKENHSYHNNRNHNRDFKNRKKNVNHYHVSEEAKARLRKHLEELAKKHHNR